MKKSIGLIGVASGYGATHVETALGPGYLKEKHIEQMLQLQGNAATWCDYIVPDQIKGEWDYEKRVQLVHDVVKKVKESIGHNFQNYFPIILGGDDSMSIGTWSGVMKACDAAQAFGLIWIDAHMDSHTPQTTPSFALHGMPLAVLMGYGEKTLLDVVNGYTLNPKQVVLMATRSYEAGEAALLKSLGVKIYFMSEIKSRGFDSVFKEAIAYVTQNTKGFGISLDLDAFDPSIAPGTGAPEPDGLLLNAVLPCFRALADNSKLQAFQIAEYDPTRDREDKTFHLIGQILLSLLDKDLP